jgi:hypothetical protein
VIKLEAQEFASNIRDELASVAKVGKDEKTSSLVKAATINNMLTQCEALSD